MSDRKRRQKKGGAGPDGHVGEPSHARPEVRVSGETSGVIDASSGQESLGERLAVEGAKRYARWDARLWDAVLTGPAATLARGLEASPHPVEQTRPVLEGYLRLAAEAVGQGYLYPAGAVGRSNFFNFAWLELLPPRLPALTPERQTELLAACWNLGENLESLPGWVQRVMLALLRGLDDLNRFEALVSEVAGAAFAPPAQTLPTEEGAPVDVHWVHLAGNDPLFLPGWIELLAPTVACVHDRQKGMDGQPRASVAVWLTSPPRVLGPLRGTPGDDGADHSAGGKLWQQVAKRDPRFSTPHAAARNAWRAAATLETSQFLVVVAPVEGA